MRIGFIGVGAMGGAMARRALIDGLDVVVFDLNEAATAALAEKGASVADSPKELAQQVDVAAVVVLSDEQVRSVVCGDDGLLTADREALDILIHSTIHLPTLFDIEEKARGRGFSLIDAGVSGHTVGAENGQLAVMVGGDEATIERCRPALETYGGLVIRVGPLGAGMKAKVARNLIGFAQCAAVYEGLRLAEEAGVDLGSFAQIVRHSEAQSNLVDIFLSQPTVQAGNDETPTGKQRLALGEAVVETCHKDLSAALELAETLGIALPVTEASRAETEAIWGAAPGPTAGGGA
jgi:3-hydroxyisobutyrate dehydrogenase